MPPIADYKLKKINFDKYYNPFLENGINGNKYKFKFKNDDKIYTGIPSAGSFVSTIDDNERFTLNIIEPEDSKGIYKIPYREIELAEKIKKWHLSQHKKFW